MLKVNFDHKNQPTTCVCVVCVCVQRCTCAPQTLARVNFKFLIIEVCAKVNITFWLIPALTANCHLWDHDPNGGQTSLQKSFRSNLFHLIFMLNALNYLDELWLELLISTLTICLIVALWLNVAHTVLVLFMFCKLDLCITNLFCNCTQYYGIIPKSDLLSHVHLQDFGQLFSFLSFQHNTKIEQKGLR